MRPDRGRWPRPSRARSPHFQSRRSPPRADRKSTRLNSSHLVISYAVFCLKKKNFSVAIAFVLALLLISIQPALVLWGIALTYGVSGYAWWLAQACRTEAAQQPSDECHRHH